MRGFRVLRALRPLRVIKRIPELKQVVNSLFRSMPTLGNVLLLLTMFWMVFGILGVQLFSGKFYFCNDTTVDFEGECSGSFTSLEDGVTAMRTWQKGPWSFDSIGAAVVTLFEVSTLEMWLDIMYLCLDSTGVGLQPRANSSPELALFFVIFILLGSFFMLQLFVGAIVTSYALLNEESGGTAFQSERQQAAVAKMVLRDDSEKFRPTYDFQKGLHPITIHPIFENTIVGCIVLNIMLMSLSHYDESKEFSNTCTSGSRVLGGC